MTLAEITMVVCPRERCEHGQELCEDAITGRRYYVLCFLCKGNAFISVAERRRYRAAQRLGPPATPPLPR